MTDPRLTIPNITASLEASAAANKGRHPADDSVFKDGPLRGMLGKIISAALKARKVPDVPENIDSLSKYKEFYLGIERGSGKGRKTEKPYPLYTIENIWLSLEASADINTRKAHDVKRYPEYNSKFTAGTLKGTLGKSVDFMLKRNLVPGIEERTTLAVFKQKYCLSVAPHEKKLPAKNLMAFCEEYRESHQGQSPNILLPNLFIADFPAIALKYKFSEVVTGLEEFFPADKIPQTLADFMHAAFPDEIPIMHMVEQPELALA